MLLEVAFFIGALVVGIAFWDEMVNWIKKCINEVKKMISGILYGVKVFVQKIGEAVKEVSKFYAKEGTQWTETTKTRTVSPNEVPNEIRQRAEYMENKAVDVTNELKMEMSL